jgi:outer membrane protein TolC
MKNPLMNTVMKPVVKHTLLLILFVASETVNVYSQANQTKNNVNTADSLSLEIILKDVLANHPSVLKATEAIQLAESGIGFARSSGLPDINIGADYARIGPVPSISIPDLGSFDMAPANNFNAALNASQTVYDFSKTRKNIELQESSREIAVANVDLVKQRLALATAVNFYALVYFQEAIKIKNLQIETLKEHLNFVNKSYESGSATKYEVLSTQVRLTAAETQKVDVETAFKNVSALLNSLLGLPSNTELMVKSVGVDTILPENLVDIAYSHRTEIMLANLRQQNAGLSLAATKVQNNPAITAFASGGFKNGYFPELNKLKANYVAGLSLKIPIYNASRQKYHLMMANSEINIAQQDQQQTRRDISTEVYQNDANLLASERKITQSELQVEQAKEALSLAEVSYKSGSLTNLDLLDAETMESESRLNLLKAQTEFYVNLFRLNISLGRSPF